MCIYTQGPVAQPEIQDSEAIPPLPLFSCTSDSAGHTLAENSMNASTAPTGDVEDPQTDESDSETESVLSGNSNCHSWTSSYNK